MSEINIKLRRLLLAILSVVIVAIFATAATILHYSVLQVQTAERLKNLELLSREIVYLDEVLTMSARVGAYTGDTIWQSRYNQHEAVLDAALIEAMKLEPEIADTVYETSKTNTRLVELERQAFDLIASGQQAKAVEILFGAKYLELKQSYAGSIQLAIVTLKNKRELLHRQQSHKARFFILVLAALGVLFLLCWLILLVYIRKSDRLMHALVITDQLTGLFNRRQFDDLLLQEVKRYRPFGEMMMLAIMDVDHFKVYNDTYGHLMGDQVLIAIAGVIKEVAAQRKARAFRIGGEEFALLATVGARDEALELLKIAREQVGHLNIRHEKSEGPQRLTMSVGFTVLEQERICEAESLYHEADQALYDAKAKGRDNICEFH